MGGVGGEEVMAYGKHYYEKVNSGNPYMDYHHCINCKTVMIVAKGMNPQDGSPCKALTNLTKEDNKSGN
jgi:hypothetical protein